jgi:hypothetical protein
MSRSRKDEEEKKSYKNAYQQILNGEKIGRYSPTSSPAKVAEKIAKEVFISRGEKNGRFDITFVKNRTLDEGGDKVYSYACDVKLLRNPIPQIAYEKVRVGNKNTTRFVDVRTLGSRVPPNINVVYQIYDIKVKRI